MAKLSKRQIKSFDNAELVQVTATSYIPVEDDLGKIIEVSNANTVTVELPTGSYTEGDNFTFQQMSDGDIEFTFPVEGTTSYLKTSAQYETITWRYRSTGWFPIGVFQSYIPSSPAIYQGSNAIDPNNEQNNVDNIELSATALKEVSTDYVFNGAYSAKFSTTNAGTGTWNVYPLTNGITVGDNVTVTYRVYRPSGQTSYGNLFCFLDDAEGWTTDVYQTLTLNDTDEWFNITLTGTATQNNPRLRFSLNEKTIFYVDNLSITIN